MAAETFTSADVQDMSIAQPVEAQEALCQEVGNVSVSEQQDILKKETQRVADSTKSALPDLMITDEQSTEPDVTSEMSLAPDADATVATADQTIASEAADQASTKACVRQPNDAVLPSGVQALFEKNYATLDKDSDGFVSEDEVNKAVADPCVTGSDAQLAYALRNHAGELQKLSEDELEPENDGVTRADMTKFNELAHKPLDQLTTSESSLVASINGSMDWAHTHIETSNRDLFADQTNPLNSIKSDAVHQGEIGDCYFMSALASTAAQNPEQIKDMIKDNKNGTYTVTFPDSADSPVTVDAPTDAELTKFAEGGKYGTWPAVLEKAFGKKTDSSKSVAQDGEPEGGALRLGLRQFTDKSIDADFLSMTSLDDTDQKLTEAMQDHRQVTAGTSPRLQEDPTAIPERHAYSVLGYDHDSKMVTIRNPWGSGEPTDAKGAVKDGVNEGVFKMGLEEFDQNFLSVAYVEK